MHYRLCELLNKVPLTSGLKRFMRALGKHYGDSHDYGEIWVRHKTLAEEENLSRSTICRNANQAESLGLIIIKKQFHKNGRQKCNTYQINWITLYELAGQKEFSDQLPVTESETIELPEIEDVVSYVERQDRMTRDKLMDDTYSTKPEELYNNLSSVAFCAPSKENTLYNKNINKKWFNFNPVPIPKKPRERFQIPNLDNIRTSDPVLIKTHIEKMKEAIWKRI